MCLKSLGTLLSPQKRQVNIFSMEASIVELIILILWHIPTSKVALKSCEIDGRLSFCCKDCCISADVYCLDMAASY